MRVALSITPIDSSSGKPQRLAAAGAARGASAVARRSQRGSGRSAAPAGRSQPRRQGRAHRGSRAPAATAAPPAAARPRAGTRHLADVAGEIVGAERLHRARPGEGARDQRRGERMLRARAKPADQQREHQRREARRWRRPADSRARPARCRARAPAAAPSRSASSAGRNLQARHGAGVAGAQQPERRIAEAELGLPDRQHHVDQIGVAVVQRMRAAGHADRAALLGLAATALAGAAAARLRRSCGARAALDESHADEGDHRLALLVDPGVARTMIRPQPGRLLEARVSTISGRIA